jgi:hypothetical protein
MSSFATLPVAERRLIVDQAASRLGVLPVIVEKDFWVCWLLGRVFTIPAMAPHVVFKGGTSLSKVFGVIDRFSEDADLSVMPASLGFAEADLNEAPSASQRRKRMERLADQCAARVRERFQPALEAATTDVLGRSPAGASWLRFEVDAVAGTPTLRFAYPSVLPEAGGYVAKQVKLELGSLTNQQPTGRYAIAPLLANTLGAVYTDFSAEVVVLELVRTFWEKATILHAEYHRPAEHALRGRFARHYADFAALWRHPSRPDALARLDVLQDVVQHKSRFFASSWARYQTAVPGSFHLVPPAYRHAALSQDYEAMQLMFLSKPPAFDQLLGQLRQAEAELNAR